MNYLLSSVFISLHDEIKPLLRMKPAFLATAFVSLAFLAGCGSSGGSDSPPPQEDIAAVDSTNQGLAPGGQDTPPPPVTVEEGSQEEVEEAVESGSNGDDSSADSEIEIDTPVVEVIPACNP